MNQNSNNEQKQKQKQEQSQQKQNQFQNLEQINTIPEREKMLAGSLYNSNDSQLVEARQICRKLTRQLNELNFNQTEAIYKIGEQLFGQIGKNVTINMPLYLDYGKNTYIGNNVYFYQNIIILDCAKVLIFDNVIVGPNVQIYTATHPWDYQVRRQELESAKPVIIGQDCWIGGSVIICPGVTIGDRTVIGAGSVVTRSIPSGVFAAGNPAKVLKAKL